MPRSDPGAGDAGLTTVAGALADPARSRICLVLMDGTARPAGELARLAGVAPSTASGHLARLLEAGLVGVRRTGRHRYYHLSGPDVAEAVESLARLSPPEPVRSLRGARVARDLRLARTCYDHLAGVLGVAVADQLRGSGALGRDTLEPTDSAATTFTRIGVDLDRLRASRRPLTRACLDWTERRDHVAGGLGAALAASLFDRGWITRGTGRSVRVTESGRAGLADWIGLVWPPESVRTAEDVAGLTA